MMIPIIVNIITYLSLAAVCFGKLAKLHESTIYKVFNFVIMLWCVFVANYLIVNLDTMTDKPLNIELNNYETITNMIVTIYTGYSLIDGYLSEKRKDRLIKENNLS